MNITTTDYRDRPYERSFALFFSDALEYNEDHGAVENAQQTANNTAAALGRLVEVLESKGIMTLDDILKVAGKDGKYLSHKFSLCP